MFKTSDSVHAMTILDTEWFISVCLDKKVAWFNRGKFRPNSRIWTKIFIKNPLFQEFMHINLFLLFYSVLYMSFLSTFIFLIRLLPFDVSRSFREFSVDNILENWDDDDDKDRNESFSAMSIPQKSPNEVFFNIRILSSLFLFFCYFGASLICPIQCRSAGHYSRSDLDMRLESPLSNFFGWLVPKRPSAHRRRLHHGEAQFKKLCSS